MRIRIMFLSIIFIILSILIPIKALETPDYDFSYKYKQQQPQPKPNAVAPQDKSDQLIMEQLSSTPQVEQQMEQNARKIQIEKLQAQITELKEKLTEHDTRESRAKNRRVEVKLVPIRTENS